MVFNMLVFDIESDGLLGSATTIWCLSILDTEAHDGLTHYGPDDVKHGLERLMDAGYIVGHNIIGYDLALIKKIYPWFQYNLKQLDDTFIMSSLFEPDRPGGHSVEQYAIEFGGEQKVYNEDWSQYSDTMKARNMSDVRIQAKIWDKLKGEKESWDWSKSLALEYRIAEIHAQQVIAGVQFDIDKAYELADNICLEIQAIDDRLSQILPMQVVRGGEVATPYKLDGTLSKRAIDWFNV